MYPKRAKNNFVKGRIFERCIYTEEGRSRRVDNDGLSNEEAGFLKGYCEDDFLE